MFSEHELGQGPVLFDKYLLLSYIPTRRREVKIYTSTMERDYDTYPNDGEMSIYIPQRWRNYQDTYPNDGEIVKVIFISLMGKTYNCQRICPFYLLDTLTPCTIYNKAQHAYHKGSAVEIVIRWIRQMLKTRSTNTSLGYTKVRKQTIRGTPQGGALSPVLRNRGGVKMLVYAEDVVNETNWNETLEHLICECPDLQYYQA